MQLVKRWWSWLSRWFPPWREKRWRAVWVDNEPETMQDYTIYLVHEGKVVWQAIMACPCGCKARIQLCCLDDTRPSWRFDVGADGSVSLHPSVWRKVGCRSHFFVRDGTIHWC